MVKRVGIKEVYYFFIFSYIYIYECQDLFILFIFKLFNILKYILDINYYIRIIFD